MSAFNDMSKENSEVTKVCTCAFANFLFKKNNKYLFK